MEQKVLSLSSGLVVRRCLGEGGEPFFRSVAVAEAVTDTVPFLFPVGLWFAVVFFMIEKFDAFVLAKEFYEKCKCLKLPLFLKDQLVRASSSIALNLAEGSGKRTAEDQRRFYSIAFGSLRECQAILLLENINDPNLSKMADRLGAMLFRLSRKNK